MYGLAQVNSRDRGVAYREAAGLVCVLQGKAACGKKGAQGGSYRMGDDPDLLRVSELAAKSVAVSYVVLCEVLCYGRQ
jgi:hypothetical protein